MTPSGGLLTRARGRLAGTARAAAVLLAAGAVLGGCGKAGHEAGSGGPARKLAPVAEPGAVSVATRNTTRLGGADPVADAAAVARAAYPGLTSTTRPRAAVIVDAGNWGAALASAALAGGAVHAPILFSDGGDLPGLS